MGRNVVKCALVDIARRRIPPERVRVARMRARAALVCWAGAWYLITSDEQGSAAESGEHVLALGSRGSTVA